MKSLVIERRTTTDDLKRISAQEADPKERGDQQAFNDDWVWESPQSTQNLPLLVRNQEHHSIDLARQPFPLAKVLGDGMLHWHYPYADRFFRSFQ
jgi:hypothetical protein